MTNPAGERARLRSRHDIGEIIGYAYRIYFSNFGTVFVIALITAPLRMLEAVVVRRIDSNDASMAVTNLFVIPDVLIALVAAGALIVAVHDISGGTPPEASRSLDRAFERYAALLTTVLLQVGLAVASLAAFPLLTIWWILHRDATIDGRRDWWVVLIPGALLIYLAVRWSMAQQVVMIDGKERWAALDASANAVRGHWWRTLGVLALTVAIALGPTLFAAASRAAPALVEAIVTSLVAALVLPFLIAAQTLLYYDLKARKAVVTSTVA